MVSLSRQETLSIDNSSAFTQFIISFLIKVSPQLYLFKMREIHALFNIRNFILKSFFSICWFTVHIIYFECDIYYNAILMGTKTIQALFIYQGIEVSYLAKIFTTGIKLLSNNLK